MPEVRVLADAKKFGQSLSADLREAKSLAVAVAFAKESALPVVDVEEWCRPDRDLRFLAGTNYALTELELLRRLEMQQAQCRIYHSIGRQTFHPKLYIIERDRSRIVYIGSSNFTHGGLAENVEVNVRIEGAVGTAEVDEARQVFDGMFDGEFSTPISPEFESGYRELQEAMRVALASPLAPDAAERFRVRESLFLGRYRGRVAVRRWLLVVSPENYEVCMRERLWGRQHEHEVRGYSPGDILFFHVTGGRGVAAFGIFTGAPFFDPRPLWVASKRGIFPWRIRLMPLGELRTGLPTREALEPLRMGAPRNWFHGFIQQSHELAREDFDAIYGEFERALRAAPSRFGLAG
jgi:HKD family nuclease